MDHSHDTHHAPVPAQDEPGFDDGLVHDHGWACGERGSMAQG